tara:strand:+ start:626 stop:862 length:237 start_codon:yes stop_codon:yes gene_type:complete
MAELERLQEEDFYAEAAAATHADFYAAKAKKVIDQKSVDARASYEAARAIDLVKYAAALDAALIDSLFAAYKEQQDND